MVKPKIEQKTEMGGLPMAAELSMPLSVAIGASTLWAPDATEGVAVFQTENRADENGSSNPLRSSNESVRTAGPESILKEP